MMIMRAKGSAAGASHSKAERVALDERGPSGRPTA
jgi:hypothetical protein